MKASARVLVIVEDFTRRFSDERAREAFAASVPADEGVLPDGITSDGVLNSTDAEAFFASVWADSLLSRLPNRLAAN